MFDPTRFLAVQNDCYELVLNELSAGRKEEDWMWFIFPQLQSLGRSYLSKHYGLGSATEAKEFLAHDTLRRRYEVCLRLIISHDCSPNYLMNELDCRKLHASLTLMHLVEPSHRLYKECLDKLFNGDLHCETQISLNNN